VSGAVQTASLLHKVEAVYPPLALQARIQGTVRFNVTIGKDGSVEKIETLNGHPLLMAAAQEAVRQYRYKPTFLNGQPMHVVTTVDVDFRLGPI
jgi:protein TonB